VTSAVIAVLAGFVNLEQLSEMVSIGTLFAFVVVSAGVIVLRRTRPDLERSFKTPAVPWTPVLAILSCVWLMLNLPVETWLRFIVWMVVGFVIYFLYGASHSRMALGGDSRTASDRRKSVLDSRDE